MDMKEKPTMVVVPIEDWEEYQELKKKRRIEETKEFELEVGKDYVAKQNEESIVIDRRGDFGNASFLNGSFFNDTACLTTSSWREATEEEVIEAFEKECVRRFGEDWRDAKLKTHSYKGRTSLNTGNRAPLIMKDHNGWIVWNKNGCVYYDGKWAEKLEEPKFAETLEDIDRPWYLCMYGQIREVFEKEDQDNNNLPTEELTEGILALTQLLSFRHDVWEKEGRPINREENYSIGYDYFEEEFGIAQYEGLFCFKKKETAEWFLKTHRKLLIEYFNKLVR